MTGPLQIYTTSTCAPCIQLKKFLDYKGIPFETKLIDEDEISRKLIVDMTGRLIVPTTKCGDRWISGLNYEAIMEAIGSEE